jgi:phage-related protein
MVHNIYFYKDKNGNEPVLEYMRELASKKGKDSRAPLKTSQKTYKMR